MADLQSEQALLIGLQKDVQALSSKVDELKEDMRNTYATKAEVSLIREWVKPFVERQKHIEMLVVGGIIAAFLKLVLAP